MNIQIRQESPVDFSFIHDLIECAFATPDRKVYEHDLVHRLRHTQEYIPELALIALSDNDIIIGHCMFTKITIGDPPQSGFLALAPVSVSPLHQKRGVGTKLINSGLERARDLGYKAVVVLGHPVYYKRFGFRVASQYGIESSFPVSNDEAYRVLELKPDGLKGVKGRVNYSTAFDSSKK